MGSEHYKNTGLFKANKKYIGAIQETQVWSLGQEDALKKEMVTHSSFLAWEIPWM